MSDTIMVTLAPERDKVRILASAPTHDILKAVLDSPRRAHPRAMATLLEGLALWHQRPLSVVLSADDGVAMHLCDALGYGRSLHYDVDLAVAIPRGARRRRELRGLGDFRDLRQLATSEVAR
jgi:hypothetical protein